MFTLPDTETDTETEINGLHRIVFILRRHHRFKLQCIVVGCCSGRLGGGGGGFAEGVSTLWGCVSQHAMGQTPTLPVDKQTPVADGNMTYVRYTRRPLSFSVADIDTKTPIAFCNYFIGIRVSLGVRQY